MSTVQRKISFCKSILDNQKELSKKGKTPQRKFFKRRIHRLERHKVRDDLREFLGERKNG